MRVEKFSYIAVVATPLIELKELRQVGAAISLLVEYLGEVGVIVKLNALLTRKMDAYPFDWWIMGIHWKPKILQQAAADPTQRTSRYSSSSSTESTGARFPPSSRMMRRLAWLLPLWTYLNLYLHASTISTLIYASYLADKKGF